MATNGDQTPRQHTHHGHRLRKLLHPNGKRIHIAATPDEHRRLEKDLQHIEPDGNFDVYIHGSKEHLDAVREIHNHHEQRRHHLRSTHGNIYDEFEKVRRDLDVLSEEMHALTDHGVSLDANFSKVRGVFTLITSADSIKVWLRCPYTDKRSRQLCNLYLFRKT